MLVNDQHFLEKQELQINLRIPEIENKLIALKSFILVTFTKKMGKSAPIFSIMGSYHTL